MTREPAVELRDVWVRLGHHQALEAVSMRVERGDFVALIGPNGGGKTTLLRVLLGLVRPDRGTVRVLGRDPDDVRGKVSYVPQYATFDLSFPVRVLDVVRMGGLGGRGVLGRGGRPDRTRALETLRQLEIADLAARPIGKLSGGQLQRVLIARALAVDPEILLLDEPTASLDVQSADSFYELLENLSRRMTLILSSHDVSGVSARVRSIACINRRLFFHTPDQLTPEVLAETYGCPVDLIAHGAPHRVLPRHGDGE